MVHLKKWRVMLGIAAVLVALVATMSVVYADAGSGDSGAGGDLGLTKTLNLEFCWATTVPCGFFATVTLDSNGPFTETTGGTGTWSKTGPAFSMTFDLPGCATYSGTVTGPGKLAGTQTCSTVPEGEWRAQVIF